MSLFKVFKNGILDENPTLKLVLGMCPTLAVTTSAINGVGMGISTTFVLVFSNLVISLLRNFIPSKVRIPAFIVVIASFVTIVQLLLKAFIPELDKALGIFIPLIVVNCIILARAESFASKNKVIPAVVDGISMGIGFTLALFIMGCVREILGNGSIFGINLFGADFSPALAFILPPGGFLAFGIIIGIINLITGNRSKANECVGCDRNCSKNLLKGVNN